MWCWRFLLIESFQHVSSSCRHGDTEFSVFFQAVSPESCCAPGFIIWSAESGDWYVSSFSYEETPSEERINPKVVAKWHFCAFWLPIMLLFLSCENVGSSLSPSSTLPSLPPSFSLWNRSPLRRLTENMRSLITGVTVPALCLRLCPTATIKAGSRSVSAPGVMFEGGNEKKEGRGDESRNREVLQACLPQEESHTLQQNSSF